MAYRLRRGNTRPRPAKIFHDRELPEETFLSAGDSFGIRLTEGK